VTGELPIQARLRQDLFQTLTRSATEHFPCESGGVLIGTWLSTAEVIITSVIGPGPKARHGRWSYEPDVEFERNQIAAYYEASGYRATYVGDWHSHPNARGGSLSGEDRKTLHAIATSSRARCPAPLMTILWGGPEAWSLTMWQGQMGQRRWFRAPIRLGAVNVLVDRGDG
jgi:integrative and conjugative element protein (TIGR02256 family)